MGTNSHSESDSLDADACIDAKPLAANQLNATAEMVAAALVADTTGYNGQFRFFEDNFDGSGDGVDGFVANVMTIAQSQCERAESYADIEKPVCHLSIGRLVDLLVKIAIDGENHTYAPRVDANQFLTVAKQCYGLDPSD